MNDARELIEKYKSNTCTPEEKMIMEKWFHHFNENKPSDLTQADLVEARDRFRRKGSTLVKSNPGSLWPRLLAAAVLLIIISAGIYKFHYATEPDTFVAGEQENDLLPGGHKAVLTLSDGRRISLTDARNGELALESGVKIVKTDDGLVIYKMEDIKRPDDQLSFNKIETPIGGQYQIIMPDGSKVWLNSASSLRYPVHFTGLERRVEITGEAYFEVSHDASRPFRVMSGKQTVEVLGTSFNIMAYKDEESIKTTLIQGSVLVMHGKVSKLIKPGQQTSIKEDNISINDADISEAMAWKNGYFIFKSENIGSIMRKISRWYNVKVEYQGNDMAKVFGGKISRARKVSEVLKMLESTGSLNFKLISNESGKEGRLIIMP